MHTTPSAQQKTSILSLDGFIYSGRKRNLVAFLLIADLLKSGIWYIPNLDVSLAVAKNPFVNPFNNWPEAQYIYWSWLAPFLAWTVGATTHSSFLMFHLLFSIATTVLVFALMLRRLPENEARTALVFFTVLPVSATAYFWISMDSVTLFLMACALAFRVRWPMTFVVGVALGMQHFEQGFCAAVALTCALILSKYLKNDVEYSVLWSVALMAGVMAGKLLLKALFIHWHVTINSGRFYWLDLHIWELLNDFFYHFQYIIYSLYGVGWLFVLKSLDERRKAYPLLLASIGVLLLLPISGDETRVGAIVSFMLIAVFCLLNRSFLSSIPHSFTSWVLVVWLIVPYAWVWGGGPKWSTLPYDLVFLLHKWFGWFSVPANQALWPF